MEQIALYVFIDDFSKKYYHENGHLPMFHITELFLKNQLESNRMLKALNYMHPIFFDQKTVDLKILARKLNISKERIRQLGQKYVKQILYAPFENDTNSVLQEVLNTANWSYIIKMFSDDFIISENSLLPILDNEQSMLIPSFAMIILERILQNDFSVVGNNQYIKSNRQCTYWKHVYLIRTNIVKCFNFDKFIEKAFYYEYGHNIYTLCNVCELADRFFDEAWAKQEHLQKSRIVSLILSAILIFELDKKIDAQNRIAFTGRRAPIADVVYQLITDFNRAMSVSELLEKIKFIYKGRISVSQTILQAIRTDIRLTVVNKIVDKVT